MTDPLKLAAEWEALSHLADDETTIYHMRGRDRRLLAAALRLAEATCAFEDHEDTEPDSRKSAPGVYTAWSEERDIVQGRALDALADYRKARGA